MPSEQTESTMQVANNGIRFDTGRYQRSLFESGAGLFGLPRDAQALRHSFDWPLDAMAEIGQYHGEFLQNITHDGLDIHAPIGTPVIATQEGKVIILEDQARNKAWGVKLGDVYIYNETYGILQTLAHLNFEDLIANLKDGDHVSTGQVVGRVGKFEYKDLSNPHLHYAVEWSESKAFLIPLDGRKINPLVLLKDLRTARKEDGR